MSFLFLERFWFSCAAAATVVPRLLFSGSPSVGVVKRLWRGKGRQQLESFPLATWGSRRRRDLLELLDRLNPTIAELTQAIEAEVANDPAAQRLMTHPGVGALTALAFVLIIGERERFQCGEQIAACLDTSANRGVG